MVRRGLGGHVKSKRTFDALGYSVDDLRSHMESLFTGGMTWDNYGQGGWEIDHIVPQSSFRFTSVDDVGFKQCWALSNLQPLWGVENKRKSNRIIAPVE